MLEKFIRYQVRTRISSFFYKLGNRILFLYKKPGFIGDIMGWFTMGLRHECEENGYQYAKSLKEVKHEA